jgi:hypothetical protein
MVTILRHFEITTVHHSFLHSLPHLYITSGPTLWSPSIALPGNAIVTINTQIFIVGVELPSNHYCSIVTIVFSAIEISACDVQANCLQSSEPFRFYSVYNLPWSRINSDSLRRYLGTLLFKSNALEVQLVWWTTHLAILTIKMKRTYSYGHSVRSQLQLDNWSTYSDDI